MKRRVFVRSLGVVIGTASMTAVARARAASGALSDGLLADGFEHSGIVVHNDSELMAAIADGSHARIRVAPGTYTVSDMVAGLDRSERPLTIQALDPADRPVFENAGQSVANTHCVTLRNLRFVRTSASATVSPENIWIYDGPSSTPGRGCSFIVIDGCDFISPDPGNRLDPTPDPQYSRGMTRTFRFSNFQTHSYSIVHCYLENAYQFGDLRPNGTVFVTDNRMVGWYFDGIRLIGQPDQGRMPGNKLFARNDFEDALAVYNEINGQNSPHPDNFQGFNSGTTTNNSNPRIEDLMFYRNRARPGVFRANSVQFGLTQTRMDNVGYVENIAATKSNNHGISLEAGGRGVLIERCTMVSSGHDDRAWVRIFKCDSQVIVANSIFLAGFDYRDGNNANRPGFELEDTGNVTSGTYGQTFAGTPDPETLAELMSSFTPRAAFASAGAISAQGQFRMLPHRPMQAAAPEMTPVSGGARIDRIQTPTLMSDDQVALGGTVYSRFDLRHCAAGSHAWTTLTGVQPGQTVAAAAGPRWFQTRCVNSAGEGLWSRTLTLEID